MRLKTREEIKEGSNQAIECAEGGGDDGEHPSPKEVEHCLSASRTPLVDHSAR